MIRRPMPKQRPVKNTRRKLRRYKLLTSSRLSKINYKRKKASLEEPSEQEDTLEN